MYWYLQCWRKYAQFGGRARRSEYGWFTLINFVIIVFFEIIYSPYKNANNENIPLGISLLSIIALVYLLAVLIPHLAVGARRLHDTNKSAWWLLLAFVPLANLALALLLLFEDGTPGDNRFGPDPKGRGVYEQSPALVVAAAAPSPTEPAG